MNVGRGILVVFSVIILTLFLSSASAFSVGSGATESVCATGTAVFIIPVTASVDDSYTVTASGNAASWAIAAPVGFSLQAGETKDVYVYATPSSNALPGGYDLKVIVWVEY